MANNFLNFLFGKHKKEQKIETTPSSPSLHFVDIDNKRTCTRLRFIGTDGSMGLKRGKVYNTSIYSNGAFIWVEWCTDFGIGINTNSCPYSSLRALCNNWQSV